MFVTYVLCVFFACQALRRAHDVTSKELQAASTVAALMPPAGPAAAASHAQV